MIKYINKNKHIDMIHHLINIPITMLVSLATLAGVSVHDTKIDKLATSLVGVSSIVSSGEASAKSIQSDAHTHVERVTLNEMRSAHPRLAPRHSEHKKHLLQKNVPRGQHGFDGYALPVA